MVRAPCCEKMEMKKGPWTPEEDQVLVDYINQYGHGNWRALPKHAGLMRCGKSCRLRWTNYLRPDIKRGNFSKEEEETVIELHRILGNRWSAIAAKLPGRTDNEIKNVWHTHLKKRATPDQNQEIFPEFSYPQIEKDHQPDPKTQTYQSRSESTITTSYGPESSSDISNSLFSTCENNNSFNNNMFTLDNVVESPVYFPEIDETFWSDVLSPTPSVNHHGFAAGFLDYEPVAQYEYPVSPLLAMEPVHAPCSNTLDMQDDMDFWYNVFKRAGEYPPDLTGI